MTIHINLPRVIFILALLAAGYLAWAQIAKANSRYVAALECNDRYVAVIDAVELEADALLASAEILTSNALSATQDALRVAQEELPAIAKSAEHLVGGRKLDQMITYEWVERFKSNERRNQASFKKAVASRIKHAELRLEKLSARIETSFTGLNDNAAALIVSIHRSKGAARAAGCHLSGDMSISRAKRIWLDFLKQWNEA